MTVEDDIGVTMKGQELGKRGGEKGYAMAALLVAIAVMGVLMSVAMPAWRHMMQREREAELIFRGEQYARAVGLFQRKFAGAFPPSIDVLLQQKFLRKKYKDPMVPDGEFQVLYQASAAPQPGQPTGPGAPSPGGLSPQPGFSPSAPGAGETTSTTPGTIVGGSTGQGTGTAGPRGGVIGVVSKSTKQSIRLYNGRSRYSEWQFLYTAITTQGGTTPGSAPAPGGRPGVGAPRPGMPPGGAPPTRPGMTPSRPGMSMPSPGMTPPAAVPQ